MLAVFFDGGRQPQQSPFRVGVGTCAPFRTCTCARASTRVRPANPHISNLGLSLGNGACLIKDNGCQAVGAFEVLAALKEDAILRAFTGTHHNRRGRCQSQRTGAGNHQHRCEVNQRRSKFPRQDIPDNER